MIVVSDTSPITNLAAIGQLDLLRLAAAVKWFELGRLSQGKAAEVARLTQAEFIAALTRFKVSPWQYTTAELGAELAGDN